MQIHLNSEDIRPIIEECLSVMLDRFSQDDRLLYTEADSARLLSVAKHVLRDERLKGNVVGIKVGRRVCYSRQALLDFIRHKEAAQRT